MPTPQSIIEYFFIWKSLSISSFSLRPWRPTLTRRYAMAVRSKIDFDKEF
ncbi:hypothetical protein GXM_00120 [Nostoc sphaeroides CCNUC1]|uniref:Uncharacterized protein n=1 Tax=Nostoc sphaeroides CCNUC1 TaxID=2653204 RepID=A0A5P8VQP1_9NOSO|nr:hypothetical protein GXM_00120 [Nostoc sphaeroides CCNUC1]